MNYRVNYNTKNQQIQIKPQNGGFLVEEEWYQALVEECKAIIVERFYNSNLEAITAYGEIGQRIYEDENYKKYGKGNREFNLKLFKDIGIGERTGYYCLQFYERILREPIKSGKFQDVCNAVANIYPKNITWRKIIAELPEPKDNIPPPTPEQIARFKKQVICGDCLVELPKIPDKSIDMIYVDPPYNVGADEWDNFTPEEFSKFTESWIKECLRILKDKSNFYIHFPADKIYWLEDFILTTFGLIPTTTIIWHYRNLVQGRDAKNKYLSTYQPILHYNFGNKELNFSPEWNDERFDVWTIATPQTNFSEGKMHKTQKPLELMERIVRTGSNEGELVLDPMAGSGTTGVACLKNNRNFILIEKNPQYTEIIHKRLNDIQ